MEQNTINGIVKLLTEKEEKKPESKYYATAVVENGEKFVKIDGSSQITPVTETVDIQNGDRVLVEITNHRATVLGNYSFPPSARKEQEAMDKAEEAQEGVQGAVDKSNQALQEAHDAQVNAGAANTKAQESLALSNEAKQKADEANAAAAAVKENLNTALENAQTASDKADQALTKADESLSASNQAYGQLETIKTDITNIKATSDDALAELDKLASEQEGIKNEMEVNVAKKTDLADVEASMSSKIEQTVSGLKAEMAKDYVGKTDMASVESNLQSQITANAEAINQTVSKVETIEGNTSEAITKVDEAVIKAQQSQAAADEAKLAAQTAQTAADEAKTNAETSAQRAQEATTIANQAQAAAEEADRNLTAAKTDLAEAKDNLAAVTNRVGATEAEIALAQDAVKAAEANVNKALVEANEATLAAQTATNNANQAKDDALAAQTAANNADRKAQDAQLAATNAQNTADKAKADVAALTKRVTSAETSINQNAEQIALNATKTEEIGDKLLNDYYSKAQTDAAIKVESDKISQKVTQKVETELSSLSVGVDNCCMGTVTQPRSVSTSSSIRRCYGYKLDPSCKPKTGDTVYLRVKIDMKESHDILLCNSHGLCKLIDGPINPNEDGWLEKKFTWTTKMPDGTECSNNELLFYMEPKTVTEEPIFSFCKLEVGNVPSKWSLSPTELSEKFEDYIGDSINEASENIYSSVESSINQTADDIRLSIEETNANVAANVSNITSLSNRLQLTEDDAAFIKTQTNMIKDMVNGKVDAETIQEWARFDGARLELGSSNSKFKTVITNTEMAFYQGDEKVAYISNNELYITNGAVVEVMRVGEYSLLDQHQYGFTIR